MSTKSLLFCILAAAPLLAGLGDLDNDGAVRLSDCKMLAAAVASGTEVDKAIADIDGDGTVSIVDAMRLHQSIGGLWTEPTGKIAAVPQVSPEERAYFAQYEELCDRYEAMTPAAFLEGFAPAPSYTSTLDPQKCAYFTEIDTSFKLTAEQKAMLRERGMVVLNRPAKYTGFGEAYGTIYSKDLPVFFTSDALLDPLYKLYDDALKAVEESNLAPSLASILDAAYAKVTARRPAHGADASWVQAIGDAETYLAVARALLAGSENVEDNGEANRYLSLISEEKLVESCPFFGNTIAIDFSQFKPRGHYECQSGTACALSKYFKSMMWLGRADCAFNIDTLRQLRAFVLIHSCMEEAGVLDEMASMNDIVSFFVGDVDAFSLEGLSELRAGGSVATDSVIVSDNAARSLIAAIRRSGGGSQLILSQAMWKDPDAVRPELPVIAQISGQRFILDSYLLGRTVEWYVKERNKPLLEEVPFCLGNNAASGVIASDIGKYTSSIGTYKPYHARLGAARVLFEKYPYWERNLYTLWLDGLRALSEPPGDRAPVVMRSRTWQDKQMNTQLASWAQLRHNTLLYAKQSYTGGVSCFYPDGYVEPYPMFYKRIGEIVRRLEVLMKTLPNEAKYWFDGATWITVTDSLASMAQCELEGRPLSAGQIAFLNGMFVNNPEGMCGAPPYLGWYPRLFKSWEDCSQSRPCIADVHTIPPSVISPQDMVLHAATGDASFIVIQAAAGNDCGTLYVGAVASFYQHDETPIKRLADSEWKTMLYKDDKPAVPEWFGAYMK